MAYSNRSPPVDICTILTLDNEVIAAQSNRPLGPKVQPVVPHAPRQWCKRRSRRYRLYADNSAQRKRRQERAASYTSVHTGSETAVICLLCVLTKKRVPRPRQLGRSSPFPRGPGSAEITKADVARNASNEGTAARTTTTKDRLVPNREDGGFVGSGESGGDGMLSCLMAMCGVYLILRATYM